MTRRAPAGLALLLLAGCAGVPLAPATSDWPARRLELQALAHWQLQGRIAVATPDDGFSAALDWRQDGGRAEIDVRAPLGAGSLQLRVADDRFELSDDRGQVLAAEAARQQLAEVVGAALPVVELRYWLVGAPAPGAAAREQPGADGRLARLEQSGWEVRYQRYQQLGSRVLPERLELVTGKVRIRVAVGRWEIAP